MAYYPNQKSIKVGHLSDIGHKENSGVQFLQPVDWPPLKEAMRLLSGNGFKLYMYLFSWEGQKEKTGYYDFSPAGIHKETGMSDEGARKALKELQKMGFIITDEKGHMEFFPISRTRVS